MMTSVLMFAPYFQTRPCKVSMLRDSLRRNQLPAYDFLWSGDAPGDGRGGRHGRIGQKYFGAARSHAPHEVSIGGRDAPFVLAQQTHVATDAGPAGGGRHDTFGVHE